jgi:hypothetical protein
MQITVDRYSLDKRFIATGQLQVEAKDHSTILTYFDNEIKVFASALHHPIVALENLRRQLEVNFHSILAINWCRVDTDYRATGGYGCYIIKVGKQATNSVSLFDPTKEIDKLCTVEVHKAAYKTWLKSLGFDMTDED